MTKFGEAQSALAAAIAFKGDDCLLWQFSQNGKGYGMVGHDGRLCRVNRVVCTTVYGQAPSSKHEAAHSCGNRLCVNPAHLRWATPKENHADKLTHGTLVRGERCVTAKLTAPDVREIRALLGQISPRDLAVRFGVSQRAINHIQRGETWAWL